MVMKSKKNNLYIRLIVSASALLLGVFAPHIAFGQKKEVRGFVISMVHTATYYDDQTCPEGMNGTRPDVLIRRVMRDGYDREEAVRIVSGIRSNGGRDDEGNLVGSAIVLGGGASSSGDQSWNGYSFNPANVPSVLPDPMAYNAKGRFAIGLNLDGKIGPLSWEHPHTGEIGIDNQMWRVLGCWDAYHVNKPVNPYNEGIAWDTAVDAMPAWLVAISGEDLDSDGDTTETMGYGDQYAFRIFYGNDNKAQFKRLPKVCETNLTSNIDLTVNQITVANADILYDSVSVPDPDTNYDASGNPTTPAIGTIPEIITGAISKTNPGYIWIGDELIEFTEVSGNTLKNIRRGVLGTPITPHTTTETIHSSSSQHDIPNASASARWSGFDPAGTKLVDKTIQANWDAVQFDSVEWDKAELDPAEQAIFIRAGGLSNFNLHNTTYVQPGYTTPSGDKTGYFNEE